MNSDAVPDPSDRASDRARAAIALIDLTDLADDHSGAGIDELCRRAVEHGTAAVCVWPEHVEQCAVLLHATPSGQRPGIATVVNFPTGTQPIGKVLDDTLGALSDGATEIDLVLPYRAFAAGDVRIAADMISGVGDLIAAPGVFKVILETSELADPEMIRSAAELAAGLGADFVKTSTGKAAGGATLEAARVMLEVIRAAERPVGLKPSGGIRTTAHAMAYLDLAAAVMGPDWATPATFRFGASGLLDALLASIEGADTASTPDGY